MSIFFFEPIPRYTIWGGTACNSYFHCEDRFQDGVGQIWAFSGQGGAGLSTVCTTAPYEGRTLKDLWEQEPALFGFKKTEGPFPLIISLVAPEDDLSLQVHPDDVQAAKIGFPMGKNEAWYFIRCRDGASIVYDHNMESPDQLKQYIDDERWDEIPKHRPVKNGDFIYIPAGMLHAMGKGVVVYEIQQSTDVTYRFYDYHRKDKNGNERPLQLKEAIECLHYEPAPVLAPPVEDDPCTTLIRCPSFTVMKIDVDDHVSFKTGPYRLVTVTEGSGTANGTPVREGSSFLLPAGETVLLDGHMALMTTTTEKL